MEEWVEKYRPTTIDDLILSDKDLATFKQYISKGTFPNCTFYGNQGIGKTSLAKIIINSIPEATYLFINASAENGIDVIRHKVIEFTERVGFGGMKFVILDECNRLTKDAQESLRTPIEGCIDDTRFILTTNTLDAVIDPIQSRCIPLPLNPPIKKIFSRLLEILELEGIAITPQNKKQIIEKIIQKNYPDIRIMIKHLEMCCIDGEFKLVELDDTKVDSIVKFILDNVHDVRKCREHWIKNEVEFNKDYVELARHTFNIVQTAPQMEAVAEHLFRMSQVLDKEIQYTAMVIDLAKVMK